MGEIPPLHGSVTLMMLCWGSEHISDKGQVVHQSLGAAALPAPQEERSCSWSTSVGSAPGAGMAPWCRSKRGVWGQWGQSPPNPPCDTGRGPLGALSIPRSSQVHPLALRGPCRVSASSTVMFLPSIHPIHPNCFSGVLPACCKH